MIVTNRCWTFTNGTLRRCNEPGMSSRRQDPAHEVRLPLWRAQPQALQGASSIALPSRLYTRPSFMTKLTCFSRPMSSRGLPRTATKISQLARSDAAEVFVAFE